MNFFVKCYRTLSIFLAISFINHIISAQIVAPFTGKIVISDTIKPEFVNGDINDYLSSNIHYPVHAKKNCLRGKVITGFTISFSGTVNSITIVKNSFRSLNEEAIRVLASTQGMWKPATVNGEPVDFYMTLLFDFWFDDYKCDEFVRENEASLFISEYLEKSRLFYESGVQKLSNKQFESAAKDFDEAIKINPVDGDALYNRGICRIKSGDVSGACDDWRKSKKNSDTKGKEEIKELLKKYCKQ